jgi:hypothetical protein
MDELEKLRYPIGRFERLKGPLDPTNRAANIATLEAAPARYRSLVAGLSEARLDTKYRAGGWTIRQLVHHVPDSHMNAYVRTKLAFTLPAPPAIPGYPEDIWAELPDGKSGQIGMSLDLLDALHKRWVSFLRALPEEGYQRTYIHPEMKAVTIDEVIAMYAWHCNHHAAHIELAKHA